MPALLVKHTGETRKYAFDFTSGVAGGPRDGVWAERLLGPGEGITGTPEVSASGSDGLASALTLSGVTADAAAVEVTVSGGTDAVSYLLTCTVQTSRGQTVTMQGRLLVTALVP